jgi:catechol 2,3-dioxygenase-like lactoylglutathione lyase family enzyme
VLGHLGLNVPDLAAAKTYYDALMPALDFEPFFSTDTEFSYRPAGGKPGTYLFFYEATTPGGYSRDAPGLQHLAFAVRTRSAVRAVHQRVLDLGSDVLMEPREFPEYPPPYFAMFWLDPFGFRLEAVCHRDEE